MAVRTRKTTLKNKSAAVPARRRRTSKPAPRRAKSDGNFANFFVPLFLIGCILCCLGFLGFMGYRTVTASEFFDVKRIEVQGAVNASKSDIEKIVAAQTDKSGVWNADLKEIREKIERLDFVKSVAVSRVLPDGLRVNLVERVPKAVIRSKGSDFWVDEDGLVIAQINKPQTLFPIFIREWEITNVPTKENQQRIKIYQKMLEEWKVFDLDKRVKSVDLTDLSEPKLMVENSGEIVPVILAKDNFGKRLQNALENIAGKTGIGIDVSDVQAKWIFTKQQQTENQN